MSKVYEVAMILHKGMDQTLGELQEMGAGVAGLHQEVPDEYALALAENYGRRQRMIPHLSNAFLKKLAAEFSDDEIIALIPAFSAKFHVLSEIAAERSQMMIQEMHHPEMATAPAKKHKTPKIYRGVQLIGRKDAAVLAKEDVCLFLLTDTKGSKSGCRLCINSETAIDTEIYVEDCRVLLYDRGRYVCEPAQFTKIGDIYYFDAADFLKRQGVVLSDTTRDEGLEESCELREYKFHVQPSAHGFSVQKGRQCRVIPDTAFISKADASGITGNGVRLCDLREIVWDAGDARATISGRALIRACADALASGSIADAGACQTILDRLYAAVSDFNAPVKMFGLKTCKGEFIVNGVKKNL